jgi:hypothetical protein
VYPRVKLAAISAIGISIWPDSSSPAAFNTQIGSSASGSHSRDSCGFPPVEMSSSRSPHKADSSHRQQAAQLPIAVIAAKLFAQRCSLVAINLKVSQADRNRYRAFGRRGCGCGCG